MKRGQTAVNKEKVKKGCECVNKEKHINTEKHVYTCWIRLFIRFGDRLKWPDPRRSKLGR